MSSHFMESQRKALLFPIGALQQQPVVPSIRDDSKISRHHKNMMCVLEQFMVGFAPFIHGKIVYRFAMLWLLRMFWCPMTEWEQT